MIPWPEGVATVPAASIPRQTLPKASQQDIMNGSVCESRCEPSRQTRPASDHNAPPVTGQRKPAQTAWPALRVWAAKVLGRLEATTTITALLLLPVLSLPCAALGATDPIGSGLAWLQSQILSDGQLSRASALVAPTQARCETAKTLLRLSGSSPAVVTLTSTLPSDASTSTQALVCQSHLHRLLGSIANAGLAERSVAGGGYSAYPGQTGTDGGASLLDTGWALHSQWQSLTPAELADTIAWLRTRQHPDGSFAQGPGAELMTTASILLGLKDAATGSANAATIATRAASYLLAQREPSGRWASDLAMTALVFEAVQPYTGSDPAIAASVHGYLAGAQDPDGSWAGDPYVTALALRALHAAGQTPLNPTQAGIRLQFVDARTGIAIPGVTLSGTGPSAIDASTDRSGQISIQGLHPGAYQLQASATGYSTVSLSLTLVAGQVSDAGSIQMLVRPDTRSATVSGIARAQDGNAPLAGVTVVLQGQNLSAITAADGSYLMANVAPGTLRLTASKAGYLDASGSATVQAGQVAHFSPLLIAAPVDPDHPGHPGRRIECSVQGRILGAASEQPLAGVQVTITGGHSAMTDAVTDANGRYRISGLTSGAVTISASLAGHDLAQARTHILCSDLRSTALDYSPRLYASRQTPAHANSATLGGIVMDAGTNRSIAGAALILRPEQGAALALQTGADGRFSQAGLDGASVQLDVAASGYQSASLHYALGPMQNLDVGQIRLRPPQVEQLLPDLAIQAVRRATAVTDPQSLRLSGTIALQLANVGKHSAPGNVALLAFSDVNANGRFDAADDTVLGTATLPTALAPNQSVGLELEVAGQLPFRDAPIHVLLDANAQLAEASKSNNTRSTAQDEIVIPVRSRFALKMAYRWPGSVMMSPVVGRIHDTNGDGRIDQRDTPRIVFTNYSGSYFSASTLHAIDGATGQEVLTVPTSLFGGVVSQTGLALADLDGDGQPEIIGIKHSGGIIVLSATGQIRWQVPGAIPIPVSVADIDADGHPEVLLGNEVYSHTGALKSTLAGCHHESGAYAIDLDPGRAGQQILCGTAAYDSDGTLLWPGVLPGRSVFTTAIANFNGDPHPEIVVVHAGNVWLMDHRGQALWGPVALASGAGGAPTVADFDGDGVPDIGVAGASHYSVFRADGSLLWRTRIYDASANTGSTAFDFDGDGRVEVIYRDQGTLRIFDGATGQVLLHTDSSSSTGAEYPLVADVDGDGHADLVVPGDAGAQGGIVVYRDVDNAWVATRSVWNQYDYSITNINDDLSVARQPVASWQAQNTFRLNRRTDGDPRAVADLTAGFVRVTDPGADSGAALITVRLGNAGSYKVPAGTAVLIYDADPALGRPAVVGRATIGRELASNEYLDLDITPTRALHQISPGHSVWIVADDDGSGHGSFADFDRSNNTVRAPLDALARRLDIAVAPDKPVYREAEQAQFTATVSNRGSFARDAQLRWSVLDAGGQIVARLPLAASVHLPVAGTAQVRASWPAAGTLAGVLAGPYRIEAELIDPQGQAYASALAPWAVDSSQARQIFARISTDRSSYSAAERVQISSQIGNLTSNTMLSDLLAVTELLDAGGQVVRQYAQNLPQLPPAARRQYDYTLPASGLAAGSYSARLRVSAAANAAAPLAEHSTGLRVLDSSQSGVGITGQLQARPASAAPGQSVTLSLALRNAGNAALHHSTVRVRVLDPASGQVLGSFARADFALARGASQSLSWEWVATNGAAAAGSTALAAATIELRPGQEIPLSQTPIALTAPALQPLTGTVSASPRSVPGGTAVQLLYAAHNPNPGPVPASLTLSIRPTDGTDTSAVAQWPMEHHFGAHTGLTGNQSWTPDGPIGSSYTVTWSAATAASGSPVGTVLASDTFTVSAAPAAAAPVSVQARAGSLPRLLMLLSCSPSADDNLAPSPACDEFKAQAVRGYFAQRGIEASVVTSRAEFVTAMRCGNYGIFAISGGTHKLTDTSVKELREAIERGAGLWLDGAPHARDRILHQVAGIERQSILDSDAPVASFVGDLFPPGGINTIGKPALIALRGGTVQARFGTAPAIVSRSVGQGRSLAFALNLATMLGQPQASADALLADLVQRSLAYLSPRAPNSGVPGAPQSLVTDIRNDGPRPASVSVQALLPAGVDLLGQHPASDPPRSMPGGGTRIDWRLTLPPGQVVSLVVQVGSHSPGQYDIPLQVQADASNQSLTHRLHIATPAALALDATQALALLQAPASTGAAAVHAARSAAARASDLMALARYADSRFAWLEADDAVRSIPDPDSSATAAARQAIAVALQAAQRQLCRQWACLSGALGFTVNGQRSHEVPLAGHVEGSRTVYNQCPQPFEGIVVTSQWIDRRTGVGVQYLSDTLSLAGDSQHRRANVWQADGWHSDIIDVILTAQWPTADELLFLDRSALQIAARPPGPGRPKPKPQLCLRSGPAQPGATQPHCQGPGPAPVPAAPAAPAAPGRTASPD